MCYSAMVLQDAKKLGIKYHARVQHDDYETLFRRRLDGEKLYIGKGMEEPFLKSKEKTDQPISKLIEAWHSSEITRLETELFKQKKRLADAERVLKSDKPTKKATTDQRIATDKIAKFIKDIERHKSSKTSESDSRIYAFHYFSILTLDENGERVIMPIRYHMRPADKDESFDREFSGCYNARFDNLTRVAFWREALVKRRGVMLVHRFYENVDPKVFAKKNKLPSAMKSESNIVLCFEPDNVEYMVIPVIWDEWKKKGSPTLRSGALITDEPAPEIAAAGHDRTPIFLKESAIDAWLTATGSPAEIKEALSQREQPHYSHKVMGAA